MDIYDKLEKCTTENVVSLGLGAAQRALELAEMFEDEIESIVDKIHELINLDKEEKKIIKRDLIKSKEEYCYENQIDIIKKILEKNET